ncbi:type II toxin-antitoxin system PemK/MazF family toxin [Skermania sp. ID1734]|uniref:type II toxin-antitoxin system PemK/MazF family toxin n=1 Tax=Skermania sp. ID1734 TaxID=2597516 RepID=UPI0011802ED9|nr:type II toxin-antitoxin system PemK/MazF family toxin [Skermania sp. ID1734]TSE00035.1 type II toxin-antitoxin system PemK/MazF family toxin [Skermania sp. ID1734]
MAPRWSTLGKQIGVTLGLIAKEQAPRLVRGEAPTLTQSLQRSGLLPKSLHPKNLIPKNLIPRASSVLAPRQPIIPGRPIASTAVPTAQRARRLVYAPNLDGRADPGEVVWTWVTYEEDPSRGKDRPVLVVGRDGKTLLGLMLSSNSKRARDNNWIGIGAGTWDSESRPSWVRLDRVLDVPEAGIRREGAILERKVFDQVAARLIHEYRWR